jgi:Holliday junction resolvase
MPNTSKDKGTRFERKMVKHLEHNGIHSRRAWGSNGASNGWHPEVDVLIEEHIRVQAKVRKKLPDYLKPSEEVDLQVFQEDRGHMFAMIRFDDWMNDYKMIRNLQEENEKLKSELELCK